MVSAFADYPEVLGTVLDRSNPASIVRPLTVYARAAVDREAFKDSLADVLGSRLETLCRAAVDQVTRETKLDLLLGGATLAAAIDQALAVIPMPMDALSASIDVLPRRADLILSPLGLTMTAQLTEGMRRRAVRDPTSSEQRLASSLHDLSNRLAEVGRRDEALAAIEQAVEIRRRLATANPDTYEAALAASLNNHAIRLAKPANGMRRWP